MKTKVTNLLLLTISAFWSSSRWPLVTWMSSRGQRSIQLDGRCRQVSLYQDSGPSNGCPVTCCIYGHKPAVTVRVWRSLVVQPRCCPGPPAVTSLWPWVRRPAPPDGSDRGGNRTMKSVFKIQELIPCHAKFMFRKPKIIATFWLTYWGRDKIAAILQMTFSNAFAWMKMNEFHLRFHSSLFLRFELTKFQHWFR